MEWNNFKDQRHGNKTIRDFNNNNMRLRDSWNNGGGGGDQDYLSGFTWPPRSYTCSFCKREFRSAQALGGHMNVHRRDRARLRQSPPRDNTNNNNIIINNNGQFPFLNLNTNPNPNFSTPSLPSLVSPPPISSSSLSSPSEIKKCDSLSQSSSDLDKRNKCCFFGLSEHHDKRQQAHEIVSLDLEIGLVNDSKEDLDLELRLGYS